jgi:hypothetical protein
MTRELKEWRADMLRRYGPPLPTELDSYFSRASIQLRATMYNAHRNSGRFVRAQCAAAAWVAFRRAMAQAA